MLLPQRTLILTPPNFQLASAGILGTSQTMTIDRTWPAEEIHARVTFTTGATAPTLSGCDNILNIAKKFTLSVNDGTNPKVILQSSGVALLEYCELTGFNNDQETLSVIGLAIAGATLAANTRYQLTYRLPLVNPMIGEPIRSLCLLPCHTYPQDPVLTVDFAQPSEMYSAGTLSAVVCDFFVIRRYISPAVNDYILKNGGFIPGDLLENVASIQLGQSGAVRLPINTPGGYTNFCLRQYLGGSAITRGCIDASTTPGQETQWTLESGQVVLRSWKWLFLQAQNGFTDCRNSANQTYSPRIGGTLPSGQVIRPPVSNLLDFLSDGLSGNGANELGSVLDCNLAANTGLKMEIVGNVASVATNPSSLSIMGHRLYGNLSRWQTFKF